MAVRRSSFTGSFPEMRALVEACWLHRGIVDMAKNGQPER